MDRDVGFEYKGESTGDLAAGFSYREFVMKFARIYRQVRMYKNPDVWRSRFH